MMRRDVCVVCERRDQIPEPRKVGKSGGQVSWLDALARLARSRRQSRFALVVSAAFPSRVTDTFIKHDYENNAAMKFAKVRPS